MKTYILLERSYTTGSFKKHLNSHRGWFCELKENQRIKGMKNKKNIPSCKIKCLLKHCINACQGWQFV